MALTRIVSPLALLKHFFMLLLSLQYQELYWDILFILRAFVKGIEICPYRNVLYRNYIHM